jgi:glycosyltransferase involved in cell wall biosynthesis
MGGSQSAKYSLMKSVIVIPTKNRLSGLLAAVNSVSAQSLKPDAILIVDQSSTNYAEILQLSLLKKNIDLYYHYRPEIRGLVEAKNFALRFCLTYDIVFFIEDDVVLDEHFIFEGIFSFKNNNAMIGCTGLDIKSNKGLLYSIFHKLLYTGDFSDSRPLLTYLTKRNVLKKCVVTRSISGGISAFKTGPLVKTGFETDLFFHYIEDKVLSFRLARDHGQNLLYFNPKMKLTHNTNTFRDSVSRIRVIDQTIDENKLFYTRYVQKTICNRLRINIILFKFELYKLIVKFI